MVVVLQLMSDWCVCGKEWAHVHPSSTLIEVAPLLAGVLLPSVCACCHRHRKEGAGGAGALPIFFWRGQSPLNILGLILRCLVNYKLLPKVLKFFALCQPLPIFMPLLRL